MGFPHNLLALITDIYANRSCTSHSPTGDVHDHLRRELKKGFPLSPALIRLCYEVFHCTLRKEFDVVQVFVYVDDIAILTTSKDTLQEVLGRLQEVATALGLKVNRSKTEIYRWA